MDPWYYNRLSNASKYQSGSGPGQSDYHQQLAGHQTTQSGSAAATATPQLLLQAAHNTGHSIPPPFNPGFLTPNPYDFCLVPNPSSYAAVSQHRALASAISTSKPAAEGEVSLRENYSPAHHSSLTTTSATTFFDHQNSASSLGWSQPNSQPFGVLPHESVSNSPAGPPTKAASSDYTFNVFSSTQSLNHLSQLSDYKNFSDTKKESRSQSPANSIKVSSASPSSVPFYHGAPVPGTSYASSESNNRSSFSSSSKYSGSSALQPQQSCIVASPSVTPPSKDYRQHQSAVRGEVSTAYPDSSASRNKEASSRSQTYVPSSTKSSPIPVQTKAQTKVYPDVASSTEALHRSKTPLDSSQSSPISLSEMESSNPHRYESNVVSNPSKQLPNSQLLRASSVLTSYQQSLNHQAASYFSNSTGTQAADYHRSKSAESVYNTTSNQNGSECTTRRTSPHASHSQASPLGHVHSPAYPMYHSPMSSMTSPSPHQLSESTNPCQNTSTSYKTNAQVTNSTTPLDASVIRLQSGQAQSVTYPSVITRALSTPDPAAKHVAYNETRAYEHDPARYSKQCWDSSSDRSSTVTQQQRKCQSVSVYNANTQEITANMTQQQHSSKTSERQQLYYDNATNQPSHDLSSFRGDPMSIVKNLQSLQQQTFQAQPTSDDSRLGSKTPGTSSISPNSSGKRRKSSEKQVGTPNSVEYYNNRIPPPAHLNVTSQQQQNGSYFSNYLSPPSTSRTYSASQTSLHHTSNSFMGSQSQGLYMSPYFSPFHLSTSSQSTGSPDYQSSSSRTHFPASEANVEQVPNATVPQGPVPVPQVPETPVVETPKIVMPDIEEELSYLVKPILMVKFEQDKKNSIASGFEASYLKFLQGERESSPPPNNRGAKKTWYKSKSQQSEPPKFITSCNTPTNESNDGNEAVQHTAKEKTSVYDVENDPRYFPLPKTDAQRRSFDTSDSDSDPGTTTKSQTLKTQDQKPIAAVAPRTANKQATKGAAAPNPQPGKRGRKKKPEVPVPRRETSRRKAKEKGTILLNANDPEDPDGDSDSDHDPAWTPFKPKAQNVESSEDENVKKKSHKKATKLSVSGRKRSKHAISDDYTTSDDDTAKSKKRGPKYKKKSHNHQGVITGSMKSGEDVGADGDDAELYSFKVGEFVVMKSDLSLEWPPIWRVDGKTLLQKFEPFDQEGEMLYRNISTYSGWTPQNRDMYRSIQVKFRINSKAETVVEFMWNELTENYDDLLESLIKTTTQYQENFEVYIQTLISQALDSNFLTEIFQERDEYFLTNVKSVDDIVLDRRQRFLRIVKWRTELEASIATWPCYNVMFELGEEFRKSCAACDKPGVAARVLLYGQPYNSTTLEGCQADPKLVSEKDFLTCRLCLSRIELYNKIAHQKYLMFIECAKRVQEKRLADSSKDSTVILNELLADDAWLHQLFRNVRLSWAEIDRLENVTLKE